MKTLTLTDEAAELLVDLLHARRDTLESFIRSRFGPKGRHGLAGRVPTPGDVRDAKELELVYELIRELT